MFKKFLILSIFLLYQTNVQSKSFDQKNFNQRYLSNYFSALVSFDNVNNEKAIKYYNSSKALISQHETFLKNYILSLVEIGDVKKAIREISNNKNTNNSNFFEAYVILIVDAINKKDFLNAKIYIESLKQFDEQTTFEAIIKSTLESYVNLFSNKKKFSDNNNFGKLTLVTDAFQDCYLGSAESSDKFLNIINTDDGDFSRYIFFYLRQLINNKNIEYASEISKSINPLNSNLLISQSKLWIEKGELYKFNDFFSCERPNDLVAEFFFLISNLYSSQDEFVKSNFYLNLSQYLNPKFYFNLSLLAENYILVENFELAKKFLNLIDRNDIMYSWYRIKKIGQIISIEQNDSESLKFIEKNLDKIKDPHYKILFDVANIYKNFGKYQRSINYYNLVLNKLDKKSDSYADALYRRGSSFERLKEYKKADTDLLNSLSIFPNDPYVLNYLAYSWLERNINIDRSIEMLKEAYQNTTNNPYITDSLGWAYYLTGDFVKAEKYINQALQLKPDDPVIMDHYADILWKLNRKIQAKYFWKNVLKIENDGEINLEEVKNKLIFGLTKS